MLSFPPIHMRPNPSLAAGLLLLAFAFQAPAQEAISEILSDPAIDFSRPAERARAMERIEAIENARLQNARARGMAMGLPLRMQKPGGGVKELIDFDGDQPVYLETKNANAAISTAANLVRTSPYTLDGTGLTVGVWDAAGGRPTHQEFVTGSRLTNMNGTTTNYHSMHVAGTIAALGVDAPSRGMANAARINSYDWNSDISEMGTAGATAAGQTATKVYLSNHSYGTADGWDGNTWRGTGTDQNAYDVSFGQYGSSASSMDSTAYNAPYFLSFWAAGNERSDNPASGASVVIGGVTTTYNPTIHPPGDGKYRNGYETISYRSTAKNIITVGAVNDAVTSGVRDLAKATISSFSSTGPTDDGRIKPDLVANGVGLRSTYDTNDTAYASISGTSMATPNACGSAALLVDQYNRLFGSAMRSSTLKALLIHTADDIGNPGPDYFFGWGLIDVKDAADLLIDHQANPTKKRLTEDQVSTSITSRTLSFTWDGVSPIRATLCWTDPAGTSVSSHDSRTPTLRNNLNLKLVAPNGAEYFPFVMPFVGTWTVASMSQNATTGINNTDNVEQVRVNAPGQSGDWQAVVSYSGTLTNNLQNYGLIISGSTNQNVPLAVTSITPASGLTGTTVTADITGTKLGANTAIRLRQPGRADIIGTSVQMINASTLRCQFNLSGVASGLWSIVATNPDTETYTLPDAFTITGSLTTLWSENFDGTVTGWTSQATRGGNSWTITTAQSQSPTNSYFAPGPSSASTTYLISPSISMPASPTNMQIEFWHYRALESGDGGRFAMSIDGGAWFDVTDADSGAAFTSNGYNSTMASNGQTGDFAGLQAWSGNSGGFIRTTINLNDIPKFAGKNLRLRWGLATNPKTSSNGWYVDSVALLSDSSAPNQPPVITVAASTNTSEFQTVGPITYHVLRGTGANLSVTVTDDAGESDLTYTWQSTGPAPVTYSLDGDNAAKSTTATFSAIGDYVITVTALDTGGLSTASTVNVRVLETSTFDVAPDVAILNVGQTQQFTATLINQFGTPNASQPSPITWSATGGGTISSSGGLFTATSVGGPYTITAIGGAYTGMAEVSVNPTQAGIQLDLASLSQTYDGTQRFVTATTSPAGLSYSVTYDGQSTAPTNAGNYSVSATITDPNYQGSDSGTLVVAKAPQNINFAALDPVYDNTAPFELTATASSQLPVSYTSSNTAVATVTGNTVTIFGLGTTTITASQAGNTNYNAAASVPQTLTVVRANPLAVTGGPYSVLVGQSVTLNGGASQPSYNETITAWEWDLNNDNNFVDASGASLVISYSTLTTTWGRVPGNNTIQLKVTDSSGKTSITSTTLTLIATLTWDANGTTANQTDGAGAWLTANQWWTGSANTTWSSSANAIFGNGGTGGAVTLASPTTVNAITFNSFTGTYTLGTAGNTITLNGGITGNANSGIVTIISPVTLGGTQTWTNHSGNALTTGNGTNLITNGGYDLTVDGTGTTNFGVISNAAAALNGSGALVKNGSGRLNLGGLNSGFSGAVTINGGVLQAYNDGGALGNGNLTLNGGVLSFYWGATYTRTLGTGIGTVQIPGGESGFGGAGTTGPSVSLGTTVVWGALGQGSATGHFNPGKFVLGDSGTPNAGVITFSSGIDLNGTTRTIVVPKGLSTGGNVSTISAAIGGTGTAGLIKEGNGTLILSAANTYTGSTTISGGILRIGNNTAGSLNNGNYAGNISIASGATLQIWSTASQTLSGAISGGGGLYKAYGGTLTLSGPNTYTGRTSFLPETTAGCTVNITSFNSVNGGTPTMAGSSLGAPTTIANGTIDIGSSGKQAGVNLTYTGPGETTDRVINFGFNSSASQTLTASGSGLLKFTSAMTSNSITTQSGALILGGTGSGEITQALPALPAGGLTKNGTGTWTLGGVNSYAGPTTISAGKLALGANNVLPNASAVSIGNATLDVATFTDKAGTLDTTSTATINLGSGASMAFDDSSAIDWTGGTLNITGTFISGASLRFGTSNTGLTSAQLAKFSGTGLSSFALNGNGYLTASGGGGDTTPPTLAGSGIVDDQSGGPVMINTTVNYTVTFSEDMDSSTISAADFGNEGTAALSINSVTETSPTSGVFTVQATPTGAGTLQLRVNPAAILRDMAGNNLNTTSAIADDTIINVDGTAPTVASITDDKSGGPVAVNTLVTYTVAFSEDMDANTVAGDDFGNAGSATVTIGSVTETLPGIFTLQATPITAGTLQLRINETAVLKDLAGNNLNTATIADDTVITVDGTAPTLAGITDDTSGGTVVVNTLVTYTVTFSEDMDANTVAGDDFGNAGSAAVTMGSVTETLPGVFTVQATPTSAGTLILQVPASAVLTDIAGNPLDNDPALVDDTTITVSVADPYAAWSGGAAFDADTNGDGVQNGMAWLLGEVDKNANALDNLPVASQSAGNLVLNFTCLKSAGRGNAVLKVQFSKDLGVSDAWTLHEAAVPGDSGGTVNGVEFVTSENPNPNLINIQATIPASAASPGTHLFGRLQAAP